MIHVATVHWRSARWIEPQRRYLDRNLVHPFRVYAFLNEVPGDYAAEFHHVSTDPIRDHATKLNRLAETIAAEANPEDVVLFLDGDAFPIASIAPLIEGRLERNRLIAVQRYENNGDLQPHPCFCITTVGFWVAIAGDWRPGHKWRNLQGGRVTDVGGNLLGALDREGVDWYPLLRRNRGGLNPLLFALYGDDEHGDLVYHHGGGFHGTELGRIGRAEIRREVDARVSSRLAARTIDALPKWDLLRNLRERYHPARRLAEERKAEARAHSDRIIESIQRDEEFWRAV